MIPIGALPDVVLPDCLDDPGEPLPLPLSGERARSESEDV
jgi:hypothetical protein